MKEGEVMAKKANNAAPKSAKMNPAMDAPNHEMGAPEMDVPQAEPIAEMDAPQAEPIAELEKPQTVPNPAEDFRTELVKKAQAAKQAALVGLIPQEQADAIWNEAVEACKPSDEAIALAKAAKGKKDDAEKVLKAAQSAHKVGLVSEDVVKDQTALTIASIHLTSPSHRSA